MVLEPRTALFHSWWKNQILNQYQKHKVSNFIVAWSNFNSEFKITKYLGNLVKLVGKNFEDLVVNNENDVFIKFYAPWCGHCKAMAEDWAKLADEYADDQSMVIAEFDATANDTRKFLWTQSDSVEPLTCDLKQTFSRERIRLYRISNIVLGSSWRQEQSS